MKSLLIIGGGQHGHVVKEIAETTKQYAKIEFLDDNMSTAVGKLNEYKIIGRDYDDLFVAIGNNDLRRKILSDISELNLPVASIIHPNAIISKTAKIHEGVVVEANAIINSNSEVKKGTIISLGAIIEHNTIIGECCHMRPGSIVRPNKIVEDLIEINFNEVY